MRFLAFVVVACLGFATPAAAEWRLIGERRWAGFENYARLAADPVFRKVFANTFLYLAIGTPVSILLSFVVAYHLDRVRFMHGLIRALYFLPFLTTAAAMAWVWRWFYQPLPIGVLNHAIAALGLSAAAGFGLVRFTFESRFTFPLEGMLALAGAVVAGTVLVGLLGSREVFRHPPLQVLREE